jgi:DNA-binding SARP family transcriptional activator
VEQGAPERGSWLRLTALGGAAVESTEGRIVIAGGQPALVLAHLVLERPTPLRREELVDLLWPQALPSYWQGAARKVVARVRASLVAAGFNGNRLVSVRGVTTLSLHDVKITVDVEDAFRALEVAEFTLAAGDAQLALDGATAAERALRVGFFAADDTSWGREWHARVENQAQRARLLAAQAALGSRHTDQARALAGDALAFDPFDERATRLLMAAHEAAGNRPAALDAYEQCRRLLDDALGVRPSPETDAAFVAMLGEPPASPPTGRSAVPLNPVVARTVVPFVGRARELATVRSALDRARAGTGSVLLVTGEAGIGKTRLAAEAVTLAERLGMGAIGVQCARDAPIPMQPFPDVVAMILRDDPDALETTGVPPADLARVVPELVVKPGTPIPVSIDDQAQTRVVQAIVRVIEHAADRPLLLVLDDAQWLGDDAVVVLRALLHALQNFSAVVMLVVREPAPTLRDVLADLARDEQAAAVKLDGLGRDDLVTMLETAGVVLHDDLEWVAAELSRRTAGNPLYVTYLVREARAAGTPFDPDALPEALAGLLERRLETLDRAARDVLMLGAVCGAEFDVATVEACRASSAGDLLDVVDALCRERLLEERGDGKVAFAHELVRDAVLRTIGATRRSRLHQRVGEALAEAGAPAAIVAYHLHSAGPRAAASAAPWMLRAGNEALWRASWAEADALHAQAERDAPTPAHRCQALIGRGRALRALSDVASARAAVEAARALARAHGLPREFAAATLPLVGGGGRGVAVDLPDAARASLLREALDGLTDADVDLLVPVLGELALALVLSDSKAERDALCARCVDVARATQDPVMIAAALQTRRVALMGPNGTVARRRDAQETLAFPADVVPVERRIAAHLAIVEDAFELGDRPAVDMHLAAAQESADAIGHPFWRWSATSWRTVVAAIEGRVDDAEALSHAAFAHQSPSAHPEAIAALGVHTVLIRLLQGRAEEVTALLSDAADYAPNIPGYRAVLALCCAESGDLERAQREVDTFRASDYDLPPDSNWLLSVAVLADAAATLDDHAAAATLERRLRPYAKRQVVLNCYGAGGSAWGPVALHLGRLAFTLGRPDDARAFFDRAIEGAQSMRAQPFVERATRERYRLDTRPR